MSQSLRTIGALVGGVVLGAVLVGIVQWLGHLAFGAPELPDEPTPEALQGFVDRLPLSAKLSVVAAWTVGMIGGGLAAYRISGWQKWVAVTVVLVLLAFTCMNFFLFPHPFWMIAVPFVVSGLMLRWIRFRPE